MVFPFKTLVAITAYLAAASAASIPGGLQKKSDSVIKLDFSVTKNFTPIKLANGTTITKKDDTYDYPLYNKDTYYVADLLVGSDQQAVKVDVDTGSSDLWVIDSSSGVEATYGTYDHSSSSSYQYVADGFLITYGDGSNAQGNWIKDTIALSSLGPTIKGQQLGDATSADGITYGILGIGYATNEAASTEYDNVPINLKKDGYIKKNAYSLYLNSPTASGGSVLFGGIDNAKYSGSLATLPVTSSRELRVNTESFTIGGTTVDANADLLLDSGTTLIYLQQDVALQLADQVGGELVQDQDGGSLYLIPDKSKLKDLTVNFKGVSITIPKDDLTIEADDGLLIFSVLPSSVNILGDTFLRNAYVVYNLDDNEISLAPVKYTTDEDITAIE